MHGGGGKAPMGTTTKSRPELILCAKMELHSHSIHPMPHQLLLLAILHDGVGGGGKKEEEEEEEEERKFENNKDELGERKKERTVE
jgi:hypothetical protein